MTASGVGSSPGAPESGRGGLRPAIMFDCDGVLNEEPGGDGVVRAEDVRLLPGAGEAVKAARDAGCLTVAVTNRAQVARGLVSLAELDRILSRLEDLLAARGGVLDRIYFCPHHPDPGTPGAVAEFTMHCDCRKPGALLFRRAFAELPIDVARTAVIGDSLRDIGAGRAAGIAAYGVRTGHGCRDHGRYPAASLPSPDLMFADVREAVAFCTSYSRVAAPLLAALPARSGRGPVLVAVAGRPCAGKSAVAHALARTLGEAGERCLHVRTTPGKEALSSAVAALREGRTIPDVEPATGHRGLPSVHDPAGCVVIILDGTFAACPSVRPFLDLAVFVEAPEPVRRTRFAELQRWNGLSAADIDASWAHRASESRVDAQRDTADLRVASAGGED